VNDNAKKRGPDVIAQRMKKAEEDRARAAEALKRAEAELNTLQSPEYKDLARREKELRSKLHFLRIAINRKEYSVETRAKRLKEAETDVAKCKKQESELTEELEEVQADIRRLEQLSDQPGVGSRRSAAG
jgi:chromosome segregation ATPase